MGPTIPCNISTCGSDIRHKIDKHNGSVVSMNVTLNRTGIFLKVQSYSKIKYNTLFQV